ncbi:MAG: DUF1844 domain-containing protein [Fidelibacterota bacterium]
MSEEQPTKEEQLYLHLVSTYTQSAWVALGKMKNPLTDKAERNLEEAEFYIDILDMLKSRMKGNLSEWEGKFLDSSISNLKLNYVEESRKAEKEAQQEKAHREPSEEAHHTQTSSKPGGEKKAGKKKDKSSEPDSTRSTP